MTLRCRGAGVFGRFDVHVSYLSSLRTPFGLLIKTSNINTRYAATVRLRFTDVVPDIGDGPKIDGEQSSVEAFL